MSSSEILKDLEVEVREITSILIDAQEAFKQFEFLYDQSGDDNEVYVKRMYASLAYIRGALWEKAVLGLSKLFYFDKKDKSNTKNRERYNLRHLIRALGATGKFSFARIKQEKMDSWLLRLNEKDDSILNLLTQRDKVIAHTDECHRNIANTLTIKDIRELFSIVYDILDEINHEVLQRGISYDPINSPSESLKLVVKDLAERKAEKETAWKMYRSTGS